MDEAETLPDDVEMPDDDVSQAEGDITSQMPDEGSGDVFGLIDDEQGSAPDDTKDRVAALEALVETLQGHVNSLNEMLDEQMDSDSSIPTPGPTQRSIVSPGAGLSASLTDGQLSIRPDGIRRMDLRDYVDYGSGGGGNGFWAEILSSTATGNQFSYSIKEVTGSDAYNDWSDEVITGTALNTAEEGESDVTAVPAGEIVRVFGDEGSYWFERLGVTEITVITDARYNTTLHKFEVKTRTVKVVNTNAESAWVTMTGATMSAVSPITNLNADGANAKLQRKNTDFYAMSVSSEDSTWTDWEDGDVC